MERFCHPSCAESFSGRFQAATNVTMLPKTNSKLIALHRFFIFSLPCQEQAGGNQTLEATKFWCFSMPAGLSFHPLLRADL
jgi:BarA-like signal transduction histidine kinase